VRSGAGKGRGLQAPLPPPIPEAIALAVNTVFDFDSTELTPEGRQAVDDLVARLKDAARIDGIAIDGYTDSSGFEE
jgi:outer membrane protein OmpA-like peptidoglycan-associated protein